MKKFFGICAMALALTACGTRVEIPPAHVGKIMTKDGYRQGVLGTSKFRLETCINYCDKLVLLPVNDQAKTERLTIFMPQDKLNLKVDVRTNLAITDKAKMDRLFNSIIPVDDENSVSVSRIGRDIIYQTYAQQIILTEIREYLSKYTIAEIASSLEKVNSELSARLSKTISSRTPFSVRYVGITNIEYPAIITEAQENAARRREMIEQENAQQQVDQVRLNRELNAARLARLVDVEKAEAYAQVDKIRARELTPEIIKLREIEIEQTKADKWNGVMPTTVAGGNTGLLMKVTK
jgi:hypothetical protein